jgi:hypothetical protein
MPTETFTISAFGFPRWFSGGGSSSQAAERMLPPLYEVAYRGYGPMGLGPAGGEVTFESASWPYALVIPGDREFPGYKNERRYPGAVLPFLFNSEEFRNRVICAKYMRAGQEVTLTTPAAAGAASSIAYVNTRGALWPPYGGTMHNLLKNIVRVGLAQTSGIPTGGP